MELENRRLSVHAPRVTIVVVLGDLSLQGML